MRVDLTAKEIATLRHILAKAEASMKPPELEPGPGRFWCPTCKAIRPRGHQHRSAETVAKAIRTRRRNAAARGGW